jgi:multiple sugar transport system substrate-binding protein
MIEGDYLWRSVINPKTGTAPMANRDEVVGWAKIPAKAPGKGIDGRDFVSMSGGSGRVINPKTQYPQQAFELLTFMASAEALKAKLGTTPSISARDDVNSELLAKDPLLSFVAKEVLPVTQYRPSLPAYTEVSSALQEATASVVSGKSADEAAKTYEETLKGIVGGSEHLFN